jgi:hypothetical protein
MIIFTPQAKINGASGLNFFIMYKNMGPGKWIPVYKSEIKKSLGADNFIWNQVQIGSTDLCRDNVE